jgi:hypothetical protein
MNQFSIHYHGARPHQLGRTATGATERKVEIERQAYQNGPVVVKARDGKFLSKPEIISAHQGASCT